MRKILTISLYTLLMMVIVTSCTKKNHYGSEFNEEPDSVLTVKYAKGFEVAYYKDFKCVKVLNPWEKGKYLAIYYLVDNAKTETPTNGKKVVVPIETIGITSCTHIGELEMIGELDKVTCMSGADFAYNAYIRSKAADGSLANIGDGVNINLEQLVATKPTMLMTTFYNVQDENVKRLTNAGIPMIFNNEWTEQDVLGRAEWVKMIATFFGKEQEVCVLFDSLENRYNETREITAQITHRPTIMLGNNFKGTWYMPGGESYMAKLMKDAGADYFYANDTTTGSLPLNFETVLKNFKHTDVWMNAPVTTLDDLFAYDERHKLFDPYQSGEVYAFLGKVLEGTTANDFWESGVVHPDILLMDALWALHPELVPNHEPQYILKLK
ncbi:MAG: ABC transporter substrate-binding protein [Paludibacteraceae bacterium]|nr:ABC transporter substrate-binding protein [Paludibacteraceae bacterium]